MYRSSKYGHHLLKSDMDQPRKVAKPVVVSCIRGKYLYMYWYSTTAVCIGLYTRYQYIYFWGTCTFVHGSLLLYNLHIYIYMCNYSGICM